MPPIDPFGAAPDGGDSAPPDEKGEPASSAGSGPVVPDGGEDAASEAEMADLEDRYLRLAAEFENYRKRTKREIERVRRAERDRVLLDWLEAVDNVERALAAAKSASGPWREGLSAIHRQMMKILEQYTVEPMRSTGRPFDPTLHEAIATMPAPGVKDGTVYHTERRGYLYQDGRVLRPAQVVVARG